MFDKVHLIKSISAVKNYNSSSCSYKYKFFRFLVFFSWSRKFIEKINFATQDLPNFVLYMLKIYIDDENIACEAFPPGSRLINGKIVIVEEEIENDRLIPGDKRTAAILLEISNSISDFIKLTADYPSKNENGWMPILDLQVKTVNNKIIHKFYTCCQPFTDA